jgi:Ni/Fe-hydrogenase subunit HybB-like protein
VCHGSAGFRVASTNYLAASTKEGKNDGDSPERIPSMWAFIVAIIAFGLTQVISLLVTFRYGLSDNQSLPPSTAAQKTSTIGTLIAIAIAASHWLPEPLLASAPDFEAAHFLPFLALFLATLFAALLALFLHLEKF